MENSSMPVAEDGSKNLCQGCSSCCRYISVKIDQPDNPEDVDMALWYLYHGANIFVDADGWYLQLNADCRQLNDKGECLIYETRPEICRHYCRTECEKNEPEAYWYYFKTADELLTYLKDNPTAVPIKPENNK